MNRVLQDQKTKRPKEPKDRKTERQKERKTEREKDRKAERQRDRETERQRDRETERQLHPYFFNIIVFLVLSFVQILSIGHRIKGQRRKDGFYLLFACFLI